MKICKRHWDKLRVAIYDRGLYEFIVDSDEHDSRHPYDPLKRASLGIQTDLLYQLSATVLSSSPCHLCILSEDASDSYITWWSDYVLHDYQRHGWNVLNQKMEESAHVQ